jgi:MipA family protein
MWQFISWRAASPLPKRIDKPGPSPVSCLTALLVGCAFAVKAQTPGELLDPIEAAKRPLWEAGVVVLAAQSPDYPAANSQHPRAALAPVFIYRGPFLTVDGDGIRGRFINSGGLEFDFSGAAAFNSGNSPARRGMPKLDYTFELGPQLRYRIALQNAQKISANLKLRAVVSTNGQRMHGQGWVLEPGLRWQGPVAFDHASQWSTSIQAIWADQTLQQYFYQVAPEFETPSRAAYTARGGYLGTKLSLGWSRRMGPSTILNMSMNLSYHGAAANTDSPLFLRRTTTSAVMALVWTPWQSAQK